MDGVHVHSGCIARERKQRSAYRSYRLRGTAAAAWDLFRPRPARAKAEAWTRAAGGCARGLGVERRRRAAATWCCTLGAAAAGCSWCERHMPRNWEGGVRGGHSSLRVGGLVVSVHTVTKKRESGAVALARRTWKGGGTSMGLVGCSAFSWTCGEVWWCLSTKGCMERKACVPGELVRVPCWSVGHDGGCGRGGVSGRGG